MNNSFSMRPVDNLAQHACVSQSMLGPLLLFVTFSLGSHSNAHGEDVVQFRSKDGRTISRSTGTVSEYTGQTLILLHAGGREEKIESNRIVSVESTPTESEARGHALFSQQEFAEALAAYRAALRETSLNWARRRILARSITCQRILGDAPAALAAFVALYGNDPTTQYFSVIPLRWRTAALSGPMEQQLLTYLAADQPAVARLVASSWLLAGSSRGAAITTLTELTSHEDTRIALLAEAQRWRTSVATVNDQQFEQWQRVTERLPMTLRAGPYYLLGEASVRLKNPEQAVTNYMRVPIHFPDERELASQSLLASAKQLEALGRLEEATTVLREIERDHTDSEAHAAAVLRLKDLETTGSSAKMP